MNRLYCVRDRKANLFWRPVVERDHVQAIRSFENSCRQADSVFAKWPGDYELLHIGDFDESTGRIVQPESFVILADPMQFAPVREIAASVRQ